MMYFFHCLKYVKKGEEEGQNWENIYIYIYTVMEKLNNEESDTSEVSLAHLV